MKIDLYEVIEAFYEIEKYVLSINPKYKVSIEQTNHGADKDIDFLINKELIMFVPTGHALDCQLYLIEQIHSSLAVLGIPHDELLGLIKRLLPNYEIK